MRSSNDFDQALEDAIKAGAGALVTLADPVTGANIKQIAGLAAKSRLPSIYHDFAYADAGGLLTYGAHRPALYRRAAIYVDKILKGAKPGNLPIEPHQVRAGGKPEDCQGARPHYPTVDACARG